MAKLTRQEWGLVLIGAGAGTAIGGALGYVIADRTLKAKYEEIASAEIFEMQEYYLEKKRELHRQQEELARQPKPHLEEVMQDLGYKSNDNTIEPPVVDEPEIRNVFEQDENVDPGVPEWNYDRQIRDRSPDYPYPIHKDEFDEKEEYATLTLSYFEGDDVLSDEQDTVIPPDQRDAMIGEENLSKFGLGSGDPNIIYIRNDSREMDYEIVKSPRSYAEEVHGFQHSDEPRRRRLRFDDE